MRYLLFVATFLGCLCSCSPVPHCQWYSGYKLAVGDPRIGISGKCTIPGIPAALRAKCSLTLDLPDEPTLTAP